MREGGVPPRERGDAQRAVLAARQRSAKHVRVGAALGEVGGEGEVHEGGRAQARVRVLDVRTEQRGGGSGRVQAAASVSGLSTVALPHKLEQYEGGR